MSEITKEKWSDFVLELETKDLDLVIFVTDELKISKTLFELSANRIKNADGISSELESLKRPAAFSLDGVVLSAKCDAMRAGSKAERRKFEERISSSILTTPTLFISNFQELSGCEALNQALGSRILNSKSERFETIVGSTTALDGLIETVPSAKFFKQVEDVKELLESAVLFLDDDEAIIDQLKNADEHDDHLFYKAMLKRTPLKKPKKSTPLAAGANPVARPNFYERIKHLEGYEEFAKERRRVQRALGIPTDKF